MQLSPATVEHLTDEAYASLCRDALQERLASLEREKEKIADTRPPFGVLARKETRNAFTRSMRTALDNENSLHERLNRLDAIGDWLRPLLRNGVSAYLAEVSPEYCGFLQIDARLDDWERATQPLPDMLLALAREIRGVRTAAANPGATNQNYAQELSALHAIATRLEKLRHELYVIERTVGEQTAGGQAADIRMPELPNLRHLAWIGRLAVLPPLQVVAETTRVEAEVRAHLADETVAATTTPRLQANRDICANLVENALEQYWNQLRAHARIHYVEERDVDEVLDLLTRRYIDASLKDGHVEPFAVAN